MPGPFNALSIDILRLVGAYLELPALKEFCKADRYVNAILSDDHVLWNSYLKRDFKLDLKFEDGEKAREKYISAVKHLDRVYDELGFPDPGPDDWSVISVELGFPRNMNQAWPKMSVRERVFFISTLLNYLVATAVDEGDDARLFSLTCSREKNPALAQALIGHPMIDINYFDASTHGGPVLRSAVTHHQIELLEALLQEPKIEANPLDSAGNTPLMHALTMGHSDIAQLLVMHPKVDRYVVNQSGGTALMLAAMGGDLEISKILISDPKTDLNAVDNEGRTALMIALEKDNLAVANLLISLAGIDVHRTDEKGMTALMWAAYRRHLSIVQALLGRDGLDLVNASINGMSPLWHAVVGGNLEIIQAILSKAQDKGLAITPLQMIEGFEAYEITHYLAGDCCVDDKLGSRIFTPPAYEVFAQQVALIKSILSSPHPQMSLNHSKDIDSLIFEFASQCDPRLLPLLFSIHGMNKNHGYGFRSFLRHAVLEGHPENVRGLLKIEGFDVNDTYIDGDPAIIIAMHRSNQVNEIIEALLTDEKIDVNCKGRDGFTALMHLCLSDFNDEIISAVRTLIAHPKTNVNAVNNSGHSALMLAVQCNRPEAVRLLLTARDINLDLRNYQGRTALDMAYGALQILLMRAAATQSVSSSLVRFSGRGGGSSSRQSSANENRHSNHNCTIC